MSSFINFWVDDLYTSVPKSYTILQACSGAGVEVPRFCYHEKLSIAGNCRMCLVEVSNSKKLVASCAVPVSENLKIYTNNLRVKKARESVLEFLLANHPLDCPICDQGGECDLQDITISFGSDRGRFYELEKRAVEDKHCGPLIKTVMTRCIHCTRCVRFISEISGYPDFGTTGRGSKMEIGTYISKSLLDELSANIIDLCPVGALTSKPYSFTTRPWELNNVESVDIFDTLCSNIRLSVYGNKIKRVLPRINEQLNEDWLPNKTRFIYDSFDVQRVNTPLLNSYFFFKSSKIRVWFSVSWKQILLVILKLLNSFNIKFVLGPHHDLETLNSFKQGFSILGLFKSYSYSSDYSYYYFSSVRVKEVENFSNFISVNSYLRNEIPLLNSRVRKSSNFYMSAFKFFGVGVGSNYFTFPVKLISNNTNSLNKIFNGKSFISKFILSSKSKLLIFYNFNLSFYLNSTFKKLFTPLFIRVNSSISKLACSHLGYNFLNNHSLTGFVYSIGFNTDLNYTSLIYQGHHGTLSNFSSHVVIPTTMFAEKTSNFLNLEGLVQKAHMAVSTSLMVKKDEEIFKALNEVSAAFILSDSFLKFMNFYSFIKLSITFSFNLPFWINNNRYYFGSSKSQKFFKNYVFSMYILNYYWNDIFSKNSKTMAKCASLLLNNSITYKN